MTEKHDFDFVVVGSRAAGLVGAITASVMGLRPLIVEKAAVGGGTTATSGGVLWVPDNDLMTRDGAATATPSAPMCTRVWTRRRTGMSPRPTRSSTPRLRWR